MRTRSKYYPYSDTLMTDWFTVGPNLIVRGVITTNNTWSVMTFDSDLIVSGASSNLRYAKIELRKQLILSGVKLGEEIKVISSTI